MRIGVLTAVYERPLMTKLFYMAVDRLRDQWEPHEVVAYVAGDDPKHRDLAEQYGHVWCEVPNQPLGAKLNESSRAAFRDGVDYVLVMGSDDLLSPALADRVLRVMDMGVRYAGLRSLRIIQPMFSLAGEVVMQRNPRRRHEPQGPGRILSGKVLAELAGCLWYPLHRKGLDWSMQQQIAQRTRGAVPDLLLSGTDESFLVDVKTPTNMWDYDHVEEYGLTRPVDYRATVNVFPQEERGVLYQLGMGHFDWGATSAVMRS